MSTAPATALAEEIRTATLEWVAELLEEPDVELQDSFLELGGHSALALQLGEYAKERFGDEYDLLVLFEKTLAEAADELTARLTAAAHPEAA
ncbi:phosphopantetheine-binding protein [Streptomyces antimicrobicus]|uniref:Phosphopantetheine-binding protein n=1 Tax=Streptomyces antimicrobicus TaxID=2883108 RepID=A0ABS8B7I2_9ACTN|nr:phosphopantetheine-binding protein [Streptomyces antimicrobicus]MCB5180575.1 phosphopantetheine-binding protein [Streptomyces antimicrobicus]